MKIRLSIHVNISIRLSFFQFSLSFPIAIVSKIYILIYLREIDQRFRIACVNHTCNSWSALGGRVNMVDRGGRVQLGSTQKFSEGGGKQGWGGGDALLVKR